MMRRNASLKLVLLAPTHEGSLESALYFGTQLAAILNTDELLPREIGRKPGAPPEMAKSVLSFAREWCLERNALFYAIVINGDIVIGSISLSHIDRHTHCATTGYFLALEYRGRGYGTQALRYILDLARTHDVQRVSASIPKANVASRRIWEKCGTYIKFGENEVIAILDGNS